MLGFHRQPKDSTRRPAPILSRLEQLETRENPVVFAVGDVYNATAGQVLTVPFTTGVLSNDYDDQNPGAAMRATPAGQPFYVNSKRPLPVGTLQMRAGGDGSFTFITPSASQIPFGETQVQFNYTASIGNNTGVGTVTINIRQNPVRLVATGADAGAGPHVRVFEAGTQNVRFNFFPYEPSFTGGVRVATGDLNNDGIAEVITIPATGGSARLRVFNGKDGTTMIDQIVFDPNFRGGGYVTVGDFNGNGTKDIIVGAGNGGGPRVQVFELNANKNAITALADFFAFDPATQTGVKVAAGNTVGGQIGDVNRTGNGNFRDQIVTTPGTGAVPEVRVFDLFDVAGPPATQPGLPAQGGNIRQTPRPSLSFIGGDASNTDGINISTGNLKGNGQFDIIVGNASGPAVVRVYDGRNGGILREINVPLDDFTNGASSGVGPGTFANQTPPSGTLLSPGQIPSALVSAQPGRTIAGVAQGGVRVAAIDWNNNGIDEIVTGAGVGNSPFVRIIAGDNSTTATFQVYNSSFVGGVNVSASN